MAVSSLPMHWSNWRDLVVASSAVPHTRALHGPTCRGPARPGPTNLRSCPTQSRPHEKLFYVDPGRGQSRLETSLLPEAECSRNSFSTPAERSRQQLTAIDSSSDSNYWLRKSWLYSIRQHLLLEQKRRARNCFRRDTKVTSN